MFEGNITNLFITLKSKLAKVYNYNNINNNNNNFNNNNNNNDIISLLS